MMPPPPGHVQARRVLLLGVFLDHEAPSAFIEHRGFGGQLLSLPDEGFGCHGELRGSYTKFRRCREQPFGLLGLVHSSFKSASGMPAKVPVKSHLWATNLDVVGARPEVYLLFVLLPREKRCLEGRKLRQILRSLRRALDIAHLCMSARGPSAVRSRINTVEPLRLTVATCRRPPAWPRSSSP